MHRRSGATAGVPALRVIGPSERAAGETIELTRKERTGAIAIEELIEGTF